MIHPVCAQDLHMEKPTKSSNFEHIMKHHQGPTGNERSLHPLQPSPGSGTSYSNSAPDSLYFFHGSGLDMYREGMHDPPVPVRYNLGCCSGGREICQAQCQFLYAQALHPHWKNPNSSSFNL